MCARVNFGSEWVAGHGVSKLGGFDFDSWELCVIFLTFITFMYEQHCLFIDFAQADENMRVIVHHESPEFVSHKTCELPVCVLSLPLRG